MKYIIKYHPIYKHVEGCCGNQVVHETVLANVKEIILDAPSVIEATAMFHIMTIGKIIEVVEVEKG